MPLKMFVHDSARAEDKWAVMMSGHIKPPLPLPRQHVVTPGRHDATLSRPSVSHPNVQFRAGLLYPFGL